MTAQIRSWGKAQERRGKWVCAEGFRWSESCQRYYGGGGSQMVLGASLKRPMDGVR